MDTITVIIDSCRMCATQITPKIKSCCDCASSCDSATGITLIICGTVLLLALMLSILLYLMKKKQIKLKLKEKEKELESASTLRAVEIEANKYEERKHYRSMLANFLELQAREKVNNPSSDEYKNYIKELKRFIEDLNPSAEQTRDDND